MNEAIDQLNTFLDELKSNGAKVPAQRPSGAPHIKAISAASGVPYRFFSTHPVTQLLNFASQEIGLEKWKYPTHGEPLFQQNCSLINSYLKSLEAQGLKLPEHPKHCGELFFEQVSAESGVAFKSLISKNHCQDKAGQIYLREMLEDAASRIGIEVRIAPQPTDILITPLTYELLLEQGTKERRKELEGKAGADQQLYNTRSALKRFCKMLGIDLAASVGGEFVATFTDSLQRLTGEIENSGTRKKFQTEIIWWQGFHQGLLNVQLLPSDFPGAIAYLIDKSGLSFSIVAKLASMADGTLKNWADGHNTPSNFGLPAISRLESLFNLPYGTLLIKIRPSRGGKRFRSQDIPPFLRDNRGWMRPCSRSA